ncbi:tail associated lysin [Staphylococcus phage PG-2021_40]
MVKKLNVRAQQYKEFTNMKANFTRDRRDFAEANRINQGGMTTGSVTYNDRQRLNNHMEKRADYLTRARSFRRQNNEDREQIRNNQSKISDLMNTEQTPETKEKIAMIKNETEAIQKNIAERNKEAEAYRSMAQELKGMQSTMGQYDTKAQRGSFRATLEDRAPSIGMAAVGGTLAFGASSYMKGKTTNQNLRDDMFFRGNLFGNSDYREVRRNMFENSIDNGYGYDAEATNSMAKSYLSFNEQTDSEDELNKGVTQFQRSGRALNIDRELMEDSYSNIGKTGGITGSSDLGSFTNTFVGALDKSKMSARSEEQLKSLDSMVSLMGQNRTLSNDDVTNAVAMQSMMASTGSKALQGEKGANAINNMSQSMQGGINDPLMLQMMGYGSDFTGQAGRLKAQAQLEKGATYDNINRIMEYTGGGVNAQEVLVNKMGVSTEQAKAFTDMYANGDLTKESFDNYKQELKEKGKDKADKDSSSVKDSEENELNRSTQKKEYQDSKTTADN